MERDTWEKQQGEGMGDGEQRIHTQPPGDGKGTGWAEGWAEVGTKPKEGIAEGPEWHFCAPVTASPSVTVRSTEVLAEPLGTCLPQGLPPSCPQEE